MADRGARFKLGFQAKVLAPVVTVLVLFVVVILWIFSVRVKTQLRADAELQRRGSQLLFDQALAARANSLQETLASRVNTAEFKASMSTFDPAHREDPVFRNTAHDALAGVLEVLQTISPGDGIAVLVDDEERLQASAQTNSEPSKRALNVMEFKSLALGAGSASDYPARIVFDDGLYDILATNIAQGRANFTVCVGIKAGEAFLRGARLGESHVAFVVNGMVAASTFDRAEVNEQLLDIYRQPPGAGGPETKLGGEHFVGGVAKFPQFAGGGDAGYLLLTSYEKPLRAFHDTELDLVMGSLAGILLGTTAVWLLVRRAIRPLLDLRDTAEAVGRGDFTWRVNLDSRDEIGELAAVFNQMTGNLEKSTAQLEQTVETLRTTQAKLIHSEKLSAVGEFVAGVAHELNNPLTTLIGYAELLQMGPVDDDSRDSLQRITNSAERCHKIVQSLLSFARQHPPERKLANIHAILDAVLEILIYELRTSNISVTRDYSPNMPRLMVDPHQLQQVFLNIVNNARQAIEANQPKGAIRLVTQATGQRVLIRFEDNGPGISKENLGKIFNPFFTTKPVGKGTGLGLSLSYGIVQEHGGSIVVESQLGRGTTFIIELPVTAEAESAPRDATSAPALPPGEGRGRQILVVDDEPDILEMVRKSLASQGFEVQVATDGERALACLKGRSFDLIISDWKMPGMNGQQLYDRLLQTNQTAAERMIFMTGDVLSEKVEQYLTSHGKTCLTKPFSQRDFRQAISQVLERQ